jgi:hypothetical protein
MDPVFKAVLLLVAFGGSYFEHLGLVQQLMMKAENLLVLFERGFRYSCRCHGCDAL